MTPRNRTAITLVLASAALTACGNARDLSNDTRSAAPRSRAALSSTDARSSASLSIEQATRKLDLGRDVESVRATLEHIAADPAVGADDHDHAALALSRAYEAEGDHEKAIRTVEDLLAAHVDDRRWALSDATSKALRRLLTGKDDTQAPTFDPNEVVSPFSRVLTKYFPVGADNLITVNMHLFGGDDATSDKLGTFAIGAAARAIRLERCPLCEHDLRRSIHIDRTSWVGIPAYRGQLSSGLAVFYFDLGSDRIPTRYEKYLPLPEKEIVSHLESGEGLFAVKDRKGAAPAILIAAPRRAQLPDVEEALSKQTRLPNEPVVVQVSPKLRPGEIRNVVRASFSGYKGCYGKVLEQRPAAAGKIVLEFAIGGDGAVTRSSIDAERSSLHDDAFESCVLDVTRGLHFPATSHGETTVTYPITFSPDAAAKK